MSDLDIRSDYALGIRIADLNFTSNTEGQKRMWEDIPWSRQALYRISKWVDWEWPDVAGELTVGGQIKKADKLSFATILEAGHASPGDQKAAVAFLLECWTNGATKDSRCPL